MWYLYGALVEPFVGRFSGCLGAIYLIGLTFLFSVGLSLACFFVAHFTGH